MVKLFHSRGKTGPNQGSKWMVQMMELTGIMATFRRPFKNDLDTLYMWCLGSGLAGIGVNHSM